MSLSLLRSTTRSFFSLNGRIPIASTSALPISIPNADYQSIIVSTTSSSSSSTLISTTLSSSLNSKLLLRRSETLLAGLLDLLPPILWAVPKSKVSHSKKSMRSSGKGLKERTNLVSCPSCGQPKPAHTICHECHVAFRKEIHQEAKQLRSREGESL